MHAKKKSGKTQKKEESADFDPEKIRQRAMEFDQERFKDKIKGFINEYRH